MTAVIWLFRKKRDLGNFSIENSFSEMLNAWSNVSKPKWTESGHFSEGLRSRIQIIREVRRLQTKILHITGDIYFAALAWPKWLRNRPMVVLTFHDVGYVEEHEGLKGWIVKTLWFTLPLKCCDHAVTVSNASKYAVKTNAPWFSEEKISVIPTVVPQHFKPRSEFPANSKAVALHIGVASNKNLELHAEALRNLNVHLRIIGEPNPHQMEMLQSKSADFSCVSRLNDDEMQSEYANADFLLFASTLEGFGMPIIEANMVGLPVITSDLEPMKYVAGEAALLCNPLETSSIRSAVERILHDKPLQDRLIQNGFENAKRFSPEKSAQLHQELYNQLTNA